MQIQWYPGHMTKARRQMAEDLKMVSLVIELADARVPQGSRNPDIDRMAAGKDRLILLNKADMADPGMNEAWVKFYERQGIRAILTDARSMKDVKKLRAAIMEVSAAKIERDRKRGIKNRPVRAMVAGIPNVGKSTLINSVSGRSAAKTGNTPGVTRSNQWIRLDTKLELLDTPGILWPKFEDKTVSTNLALLGSIRDDVLPLEELALVMLDFMKERYPDALRAYLRGPGGIDLPAAQLLEEEARARGCMKGGGAVDYERASRQLLTDFRNGRLGRVTLEQLPEAGGTEADPAKDPQAGETS